MITPDDLPAFRELSDEWEEVFDERLPLGPMMSSDMFPMLRRCLRLKSQKPYDDYIKALVESGNIY